jgi:hypothetical protein
MLWELFEKIAKKTGWADMDFQIAAGNDDEPNSMLYWLNVGADLHGNDDEALLIASLRGKTKNVKALLERGARVDAQDGAALWMAAGKGHAETVYGLLEAGAGKNCASLAMALRWAKDGGHVATEKILTDWQKNTSNIHPALSLS